MAWSQIGVNLPSSHYLSQCWPDSLMHICSTRREMSWVNRLRSRKKWPPFQRQQFQMGFVLKWKVLYFDLNSLNCVTKGLIDNKAALVQNALAPNKRQTISWINVDQDPCRQMISLGLNELTHWGRYKMATIFQTTFSNAFIQWKYMHFD